MSSSRSPFDEKAKDLDAPDGKGKLPVKCFRSPPTYHFYELCKWRRYQIAVTMCFSLFLAAATLLSLYLTRWLYMALLYCSLCFWTLFLLTLYMSKVIENKKSAISKLQRKELCRRILTQRPGLDLAKLDPIVADLNKFLNKERLWRTPYFFYSSASFINRFRLCVYLPLKSGNFDDDVEIAMLLDAAKAWEKSVYDPEHLNEKREQVFDENVDYGKLPRDIYRSKLWWFLRINAKSVVAMSFAITLLAAVGFFSSKWKHCCSFIFLLMDSVRSFYDRGVNMTLETTIKLMEAVDYYEPGDDNSKWDEIAKQINYDLKQKKNISKQDLFFDGENCRQIFWSKLSLIIADRKQRQPELIPFAHKLMSKFGWSDEEIAAV
ncbi:uncharacterized protein LALA0_S04e07008g [Lachancea lanzarotensis]|uniref:LALA0S04e07008g1_1 n=1 Tax=Lachancea lanzarotensis TaxID=1245769 RepID=A0A0C7N289_9SACH|nr:uncharacterized protein LALA0_S04e07008g [Lachancea lanzarotensis]CEP62067.1 LALA0S04e07008g1_1 [Lachancea lanzarotensis]